MSPLHSRTPALPFPTAVPVQNHASGRRGEVEREQARGSGSTRRSADSVYTSHNMCTNTLRVPHGSLLLRANFRDFPRTIPFRKQHAKSSLAAVVYFFFLLFFFPSSCGEETLEAAAGSPSLAGCTLCALLGGLFFFLHLGLFPFRARIRVRSSSSPDARLLITTSTQYYVMQCV